MLADLKTVWLICEEWAVERHMMLWRHLQCGSYKPKFGGWQGKLAVRVCMWPSCVTSLTSVSSSGVKSSVGRYLAHSKFSMNSNYDFSQLWNFNQREQWTTEIRFLVNLPETSWTVNLSQYSISGDLILNWIVGFSAPWNCGMLYNVLRVLGIAFGMGWKGWSKRLSIISWVFLFTWPFFLSFLSSP